MPDEIDLLDAEFDEMLNEKPVANPVKPEKKPQPQPKPQPAPAAAPAAAPVAATEEKKPEAKDPAKEPEPAGVVTVKFGETYSGVPIPRFKGAKDIKSRIALLSSEVKSIKMHFKEGMGTFLCFDGACCEHLDTPRIRYVLPIVQYTTDKNGNISDKSWEVKALALGTEAYKNLADVVTMSGRKITDVDIVVSCSDDQYQKLTFAADASRPCAWKSFDDAKQILKYYRDNANKIHLAVGRQMSEATFLRKLGVVAPATQEKIPEISPQTPPDLNLLLEDE